MFSLYFLKVEPIDQQSADISFNIIEGDALRLAFKIRTVESCFEEWRVVTDQGLMNREQFVFSTVSYFDRNEGLRASAYVNLRYSTIEMLLLTGS